MNNKRGFSFQKLFMWIWLVCVGSVLVVLLVSTKAFSTNAQDTIFGNSKYFLIALSLLLVVGGLFFILFIVTLILNHIKKRRRKHKEKFGFTSLVLEMLFFPFIAFYKNVNPKHLFSKIKQHQLLKTLSFKSFIKRVISTLLYISLMGIWSAGYFVVVLLIIFLLGFTASSVSVDGSSMLPTLVNGENVSIYRINKFSRLFKSIKRGDIVTFSNDKTLEIAGDQATFVKRVIAIEGDLVEIRDGFVKINNQRIVEPYINKSRSTFGDKLFPDCKTTTVPEHSVFVLGDNRGNSADSRYMGFVSINDIHGVIPISAQKEYKNRWHDASKDSSQAGLPTFDKVQYYDLFNKVRIDNGLKPLKVNTKLEDAAKKRAETIVMFNEVNIQPEGSQYPPDIARAKAGYFNIVYSEINTSGYFDSEDLATYWMQYDTKETVLNKDYQDMGISSYIGLIGGCETQVIVQEFGGYVPPSYKQADIDSWKKSLDNLNNIEPGWERLRNYTSFYNSNKADVDRINDIIDIRRSRIGSIYSTMSASKWLSSEQQQWIKEDVGLYNEQQSLANKLNSR